VAATLAFDIYGTLIDTNGITQVLEQFVGDQAGEFSRRWREKQLEYTFRRGLMGKYREFGICTRQALDYLCLSLGHDLSDEEKQTLMDRYRTLPAYPDVKAGLDAVTQEGFRLYAFSNGSAAAVTQLLEHAGIDDYFIDVVSVDEVKSFKPDPEVYRHFLKRAGARAEESWLISGNPFDAAGALSVGMQAAWVRRSSAEVFDPWELQPTVTIATLAELTVAIKS
jgi:2-haloacid dehalogenase